jgi:hypothetical protein
VYEAESKKIFLFKRHFHSERNTHAADLHIRAEEKEKAKSTESKYLKTNTDRHNQSVP